MSYVTSYYEMGNLWAETADNGRVRPAKIQISLRIRAVWSEFSLGAFRTASDTKIFRVDSVNSNQTAQSDLSLRWAHMSDGSFSELVVHLFSSGALVRVFQYS